VLQLSKKYHLYYKHEYKKQRGDNMFRPPNISNQKNNDLPPKFLFQVLCTRLVADKLDDFIRFFEEYEKNFSFQPEIFRSFALCWFSQ
jgi:hypothetical protein